MDRSRSGDECRENSPWNVAEPWVSSLDDDQDAFAGHTHAYRDNQGFSDNDNDNDDCDVYGGPWSSHSERPLEQQLEKQSNSEERQDSDDEDFNNGAEDNLVGLDETKQVENGEDAFYNEDGQESLPVEQDREDEDGNMIAYAGRAKTPKRKSMASLRDSVPGETFKKPKKKSTNVWNTKASRKGSKKNKASINNLAISKDFAFITSVHKVPDRMDDSPDMTICLSKIYKAEKIELSEDRLTAGSMKGYRMVRATRGVVEGAWYFEIKIINLGESGHTRLGWSTEKGDLQAPVGCDANSYSYRDIEGSKVHKGFREPYGEEYGEGDVIGFYISLPEGAKYAPEPPQYVYYRGQLHTVSNSNSTEEQPQTVPGSEIMLFKNGVCQGVAFSNILAGRYYPAASMYTLPNQPLCKVKFNFGPNFEYFPEDFGEHPKPNPMYEAPFCGLDGKPVQQGESNAQNEVDTQPTI